MRIARALAHLAWADEQTLRTLREAGPGFERALERYAHLLAAEHVWLRRLQEHPAEVAVWPDLTLEECAALARRNAEELAAYAAALAPQDLEREVAYRNSAGQSFASAIGDVLLHVCLHGAYHRGEVTEIVRRGGATAHASDYIGFVRGVPAATRRN